MANQTYQTPDNPGFVAGFQFVPWLCGKLFLIGTQWLATCYMMYSLPLERIPPGYLLFDLIPMPWQWIIWEFRNVEFIFLAQGNRLPFGIALMLGGIGLYHKAIPSMLFKLKIRKHAGKQGDLYGSARAATSEDIEKMHLFNPKGILIGGFVDEENHE